MIKKTYPTNPVLDAYVEAVGRDYYEERWNSLSPISKFWYTLRGKNPGGRGGAPPIRRDKEV